MTTFTVKFDCDNAAFTDNGGDDVGEIVRIMRDLANKIEVEGVADYWQTIRDSNGNDVGRWRLK